MFSRYYGLKFDDKLLKLKSKEIKNEFNNLIFQISILLLIFTGLVYFQHLVLPSEYFEVFEDWLINLSSAISVISLGFLIVRTKIRNLEIKNYLFLTVGIILLFIAEVTYSYYEIQLDIKYPFPSFADIFYLAGYLFIGIQIYKMFLFWYINKKIRRVSIIIVSTIISAITGYSLLDLYSTSISDYEIVPIILTVLYIVGDLVIVTPAILILWNLRTTNPFYFHWLFIALFLTLILFSDIIFYYEDPQTRWLWTLMYIFSYIFLYGGLIWFDKLSQFLSNAIDFYSDQFQMSTSESSSVNFLEAQSSSNNIEYKRDEFEKKIMEFSEMQKSLVSILDNTKTKLNLLMYSNDHSQNNAEEKIMGIVLGNKNLSDKNIVIKILISKNLQSSYRKSNYLLIKNVHNIEIHPIVKPLKNELILLIIDNNLVFTIEKINLISSSEKQQEFSNQINDETGIAILTNKKTTIESYSAVFENQWFLSILNEKELKKTL